ncbi:MAG: hypothetical protein ACLQBA_16865 [Candidatus Binataceae bacterium]
MNATKIPDIPDWRLLLVAFGALWHCIFTARIPDWWSLVAFGTLWSWIYFGFKHRRISIMAQLRGEDATNIRMYHDYGPPGVPILLVSFQLTFVVALWSFLGYIFVSKILLPYFR